MSTNVIPFPVGKRVTSENIGIGGVLYYRLECIAKRIHFLIEVANEQDTPTPGVTYRWIRKRTVKRCMLAISQKGQSLEDRIHSIRESTEYSTALEICLRLLQEKKGTSESVIGSIRENIQSHSTISDKGHILILLTGFNLKYGDIVHVLNRHIELRIHGLEDDVYRFCRQIPTFPIQDN